MWQPEPAWSRLSAGPSNGGVWRDGDRVVKRLLRPEADDRARLDPGHPGFWRREAEVALQPDVADGPGLRAPGPATVEEDGEGLTLVVPFVEGPAPTGLFVARALGRFAAAPYAEPAWASRSLLAERLALAADRGGWPTLARTTLADVTDRLWQRRGHWLGLVGRGPQGRLHGDLVPGNLVARAGEDVVAIDWQCFGTGPVGSDVGYYALSSREDFDVLVDAFLDGAGPGTDPEAVRLAARVTAAYSVLGRAEWALARVAKGEGALAGKFRHPAVAPYLRDVQRQFAQLEALL